MRSFRSRNRRVFRTALLLAAGLSLGHALAQEGPSVPAPDAPGGAGDPDTRTLRPRLGARGGDIEVTEIGNRAIGVGTLTGEESLPREIWKDTHIETLRQLLPRMPVGVPSPAMNDLARRLLLSSVATPQGSGAAEIFSYMRLERLYAAGLVEDAVSFGTLAAETHEVEGILAILARAQLLMGEDRSACRTASRMRLQSDDAFWTRLRAFCYVEDNAAPAALLTANLLEEQKQAPELYLRLLRRLANNTADDIPEKAFEDRLSALEMAMLRRAGLLPPPAAVEHSELAVIRTLALAHLNRPTAELVSMRLAAAEEAARRGALRAPELERIYASVPFEPQVRTGAVRYAQTQKGPWANALLYQVARAQGAPAAAEYVAVALQTSRNTPAWLALAALYADFLEQAPATLEHASHGFELGLGALAAGDIEAARRWRDILKSSALAEATSGAGRMGASRAAETRTLGALLRIAGEAPDLGWQPALADGWTKAANQGLVPEIQVARELMMLKALGHELTPAADAWLNSVQAQAGGYMAGPDVLQALEMAAAAGRMGETAVLALIAIGPGGPQEAHPIALGRAVRALRAVGLEREARRLALESVLAVIPS